MKNKYISGLFLISILSFFASCSENLDLYPLDAATDAMYWKTADQFKAASNDFYYQMQAFSTTDSRDLSYLTDNGTDLTAVPSTYGQGNYSVSTTDIYWQDCYKYIRANNILIQKAASYSGPKSDIVQYLGAGHFFRAWNYFELLKRFGGVPLITKPLTTDSTSLFENRNSRYEITKQILSDLDSAIVKLPLEASISTADKGKVSKQAAKAFKARVLLFEGTWEKYVGTSTDGDGTSKGAGNKGYNVSNSSSYLTEAASLALEIINDNTFSLFTGCGYMSYYYLFVLDDAKSNPKGLTKSSNKEFLLKTVYDYNVKQIGRTIAQSYYQPYSQTCPSRKMMDMYLCLDGLPYQYSTYFNGYAKMTSEFSNNAGVDFRDNRLKSIIKKPGNKYWGWGSGDQGGGADYSLADYLTLFNWPSRIATYYPDLTTIGDGGYTCRKYVHEHPNREAKTESYDYPQIRLAEVYLIYAEAKCELGGGNITDADLNISINPLRDRAGVTHLSNSLIIQANAANPSKEPLTLLGEIRRERALELYCENSRFTDLKRWGIAENELDKPILGMVVQYNNAATEVTTFISPITNKAVYKSSIFSNGVDAATGALILDPTAARKFDRNDYLYPLPTVEIQLNSNLKQNPGY